MCMAAALSVKERLIPAVTALQNAIAAKSREWDDIIKIGRTHMQDATPLTLGQEWSGYAGMLSDDLERLDAALPGVYRLALGGTAVGTGVNSAPGFAEAAAAQIARLTGLPIVTHSTTIMTDGCVNFRKFLVEGTTPNLKQINEYVERSLMLVTALSPLSGYDKASKIAHYAMDNDLTLKESALKLGFVTEAEFDRVVDPKKMVKPYVAAAPATEHAA